MGDTHAADPSSHDIALTLIDGINRRWGLRIETMLLNEALPPEERRRRTIVAMAEAAFEAIDRHAEDAGEEPDGIDNEALIAGLVGAKSIDPEPNIVVDQRNFAVYRDAKGDQVRMHVTSLTKRLDRISQLQSIELMAAEFTVGELIAVGIAMTKALRKLMIGTGTPLKKAIGPAIKIVGQKMVTGTVIAVLVGLLFWLATSNPKRLLGILFNDTEDDLTVRNWEEGLKGGDRSSGLFMKHGEMKVFPIERVDGEADGDIIQVRGRMDLGDDEDGNATVAIFGGIFMCEKRNGFLGAEGLLQFSGLPNALFMTLMFAVPYSKDNGAQMSVWKKGRWSNKREEFQYHYEIRKVDTDRWTDGYHCTAHMNGARGGVVSMIASIGK